MDRRLVLAIDGLASSDLEGVAAASSYVQPRLLRTILDVAPLRTAPDPEAEVQDELVFGEGFRGLCDRQGFIFGQALRDGYVGWVEAKAFSAELIEPDRRVRAIAAFTFKEPSIKAPAVRRLPMNALLASAGEEGRFVRLKDAGWAPKAHLAPIGVFETDPAAMAVQFLGVPYLWGGRTALGLDCSGLVQQAFYACGLALPRDSDQQMAFGRPLAVDETLGGLERNDLVFWAGHVGVMVDAKTLLHANAGAMSVALEDLSDAVARIKAAGSGPPIGFRRLCEGPSG